MGLVGTVFGPLVIVLEFQIVPPLTPFSADEDSLRRDTARLHRTNSLRTLEISPNCRHRRTAVHQSDARDLVGLRAVR